jgi:hypothetical protein
MAYNGSGTFSIINTFVYDTVVSETAVNANFSDIATGLSTAITKDGQTTITANIPFATYKITGLGDGSAAQDAAALHQIQDQDGIWCGTAGGSKNALTLTPSPAITAYAAGQSFTGIIGGTSSDGAVTLAVSGLTARAVQIDGSACSASVYLETGKLYRFDDDGTQYQATRLSQNLLGALVAADIGVTVQGYDADIPTVSASQAEMEAGTETALRSMSPSRVKQAIDALGAGGTIVQVVNSTDTALATGTTTMPYDDTIPQNTEGDEYMTLAITPTSATNKLLIIADCQFASSAADHETLALFQDSTAGALAAAGMFQGGNEAHPISLMHYMTSGTTSSTTFKLRLGNNSANTTSFNGKNGARKYGGVSSSSLTIMEISV